MIVLATPFTLPAGAFGETSALPPTTDAYPWHDVQVPPQQKLEPAPPPANARPSPADRAANFGLPPNEPAPSWAANRPVNFLAPPQHPVQKAGAGAPQLAPSTKTPHFEYHNGPVQSQPQLYLIYWGKSWENGNGALLDLEIVYHNLEEEPFEGPAPSTNSWEGILNQYTHVLGGYHDARVVGKEHINGITHPSEVNRLSIERVILEWIEHGATVTENTQFVVLPSPGATYGESFGCGWHTIGFYGEHSEHEYTYSVVPYAQDLAKCDYAEYKTKETKTAQYADSTGAVASHEFAESVTDPALVREFTNANGEKQSVREGWKDSTPGKKTEGEVADLCGELEEEAAEHLEIYHAAEDLPAHGKIVEPVFIYKLQDNEDGNTCRLQDPPPLTPSLPGTTTEGATPLGTSATVSGVVNPNGIVTSYQFELGTTTSYGIKMPSEPYEADFGNSALPETAVVTGLSPATTYHYRVVATSWVGTTVGEDRTFKTHGWTIQPTVTPPGEPTDARLLGVSCWAVNGCDAVGTYTNTESEGIGLVERWNGAAWAVQPTQSHVGARQNVLEGVSCLSASECFATGYYELKGKHYTLAERWNGALWQLTTIPSKGNSAELESVSCPSASECIAVGWYVSGTPAKDSSLVELWNGTEWKVKTSAKLPEEDEEARFHSVACAAAKACTAVGEVDTARQGVKALAESWNGTKWTLQATPAPPHALEVHLHGVSCSSATACTAVGHYKDSEVPGAAENSTLHGERALIERWTGTEWQVQTSPSPIAKASEEEHAHWDLNSVACPSGGSCIALGGFGTDERSPSTLLSEEWNGTTWAIDLPPQVPERANALEGISCTAPTTCTAAGFTQNGVPFGPQEALAERLE